MAAAAVTWRRRWSLARFRLVRAIPPLLVAALLGYVLVRGWLAAVRTPEFEFRDGRVERVERVLAADTLLLANGFRVRLIGVEVPRPDEPAGPEAIAFLRDRVEGREVKLRFDRERLDRDERILAFVFVDGTCVNESLIAAGHAKLLRGVPYSSTLQRAFGKAEESARERGLGLWAE